MAKRVGPKPLCEAGCGQRVKDWRCRWCSTGCVPHALREAAIRKARTNWAYRRRALFFRTVVARLTAPDHKLTREDLLDSFAVVYRQGWTNGYHAADRKHARETAA
jgi:hypothetical protein